MVNFGERLKYLRTTAGMTQQDLAQRLNVTKSVVSYYELHSRNPSPAILIRLASVFHVSTDYLLGIEHEKTLDISDLSEEDLHLILLTVEALRKKKEK